MAFPSSYGPVRIIPASAIRDSRHFFQPSSTQDLPPGGGFYLASGFYNPAFMYGETSTAGPYGQNAYVDSAFYRSPPYYDRSAGATSGAYRSYPQPQPSPPLGGPYRRSRTAPPRTARVVYPAATPQRRSRGYSADPSAYYDQRYFRSYSGPVKKPAPLYRKRREPSRIATYQETEFGGAGSSGYYGGGGGGAFFSPPGPYLDQSAPTLRRLRPYYAPSYTTYPPSTMQAAGGREAAKRVQEKYPCLARAIIKAIELVLAAAILGLVLGPMRGSSFHDFVLLTRTEWQGCVVGIVAVFAILSLVLLCTCFLANTQPVWRQIDVLVSAMAAFLYVLASFLEAYFAACYPPNGYLLNLVCHRAEWIIACILCFFNLFTFIIDLVLALRTGVTVL